ncbi:MAG TPA: helix-turn-helix domain-containing protein [Phycicoccus elongatus]|jgi:DNA-binding PucR family transcriptional regulator|uniref:PucR family transcriptional regulator n=2 Tax=Intrasporangiaceae TaxID=85021 RepID=UPI002CB5799B|nr:MULTISPECIES: helix-turn-helix domain-containing protein [Phycicoccus]HPF76473.1 helix-turn-helix domain-containing protein [Phycicoccus elongatus]HPK11745.1 helix-turn-helix domain-containing protein [Phycicoccus elongatus]HPQ72797.1 helix-turn-helix domain-containing protein [Phycicoccus elongatus]HRC17699.1 helix-turn-helix domain-containing protein [Phycicoccus elongatus]HRV57572.1 helix-turn-helix domain-containing protein [Phycicoccus sp.]
MPAARHGLSRSTVRAIRDEAGALGAASVARLSATHEWFRALPADQSSWVALVAHSGIGGFTAWLDSADEGLDVTADVFGTAPRELTRSISLAQTLDLLRTVVDVVEEETEALAPVRERAKVREAVLRYSREVAFGAATVYAQAAESRGAWDARLESVVVDAVLRGEADQSMQSRAAALGWGQVHDVAVMVAAAPPGEAQAVVSALHRAAHRVGVQLLAAVQGGRVVVILGGVPDPLTAATGLVPTLGEGPVVVGPRVPHLFAAGRSARAAQSGYAAAPARAGDLRPVLADDLLAERALLGDAPARSALVSRVHRTLQQSPHLWETAAAYLEGGQGVEGTARALFVHANTVRYRLGAITRETGLDLADPHDALTARLSLLWGRLDDARKSPGQAVGRP